MGFFLALFIISIIVLFFGMGSYFRGEATKDDEMMKKSLSLSVACLFLIVVSLAGMTSVSVWG